MAQSSNLFGSFLEAAKGSGGSTVETVTGFASRLNSALVAASGGMLALEDVIPRILRATDKLDVATMSRIVDATGLSVDAVAKGLDRAVSLGLVTHRQVGDSIAYDPTSEGKRLM